MTPAHVVEIETPKKVRLNGLWFGLYSAKATRGTAKKPRRVIVWVHGLGDSAFSRREIIAFLAKEDTAVLAFNNRGHDTITRITRGKKRIIAGAAHEKFEDCVDDIQGAVDFVRGKGVKQIYLAGHSTGCQKSIYWAAKKKGKDVSGIILLAPIADYAGLNADERALLPKATRAARALVSTGKPHEFLPNGAWPTPIDAQRFLSLYTPDSVEQSIFSYFDPTRIPRLLRSVHVPMLVLLAEQDEYADRPATDIAAWFGTHHRSHRFESRIIPNVGHSFKGGEARTARVIRTWIERV